MGMLSLNCAVCSGAIHLSAAASLIGHLVMRLHKDKLAAPLASQPGFALVSFLLSVRAVVYCPWARAQLSAVSSAGTDAGAGAVAGACPHQLS